MPEGLIKQLPPLNDKTGCETNLLNCPQGHPRPEGRFAKIKVFAQAFFKRLAASLGALRRVRNSQQSQPHFFLLSSAREAAARRAAEPEISKITGNTLSELFPEAALPDPAGAE